MTRIALTLAALALTTPAWAGDSVDYTVGSAPYEGLFADAPNAKATIVILPTWNGISDYEKDRAEMFAALGYDAFAADLHGKGKLPRSMEEKQAAYGAITSDRPALRTSLQAAVETAAAKGDGPVIVMGYSLGAGATMELVYSGLGNDLGVAGYAVFSGKVSDAEGRMIPEGTAPIFVAHGEKDERIPASGLINFTDDADMSGVEVIAVTYEGRGHLFSAFGFPNYDAEADKDSWEKLQAFLSGIVAAES